MTQIVAAGCAKELDGRLAFQYPRPYMNFGSDRLLRVLFNLFLRT